MTGVINNVSEGYHVIHPSTYSFCVESYLKKMGKIRTIQ